jgi:hypothetical protein
MWTGQIKLDDAQVQYLADMVRTGLYGDKVAEVVDRLIASGIRSAIEAGHIKLREFSEVES